MNIAIENLRKRYKNKKIVFVYGKFEILHPGHLRLLKFAKESGDVLIVGVFADSMGTYYIPEELRLEAVQASIFVNESFLLDIAPEDAIQKLHPDVVVKGSEHEERYNPETEVLKSYGGKLLFSSGDIRFSSLSLLQDEFRKRQTTTIQKPISYLKRHKIETDKIISTINQFNNLNVLVIGDTIIDEYITCDPLGMSQEDPTIVVSPISSDIFLGGAGIVAAHAAGLGAKVDFFTVLGEDHYATITEGKLKEYGVNAKIYKDSSRPTTLKQRFRANRKTLLRVNHLKQHHISIELQDKIVEELQSIVASKDLIVFSDFSYGCLPQRLIDKITQMGLEHNIMMVADSQSSSQTGDISKFQYMNLVTPTEREARLGVNDFESGLIVLAEKLRQKSHIKNVFITLGSEGVLIHADRAGVHTTTVDNWITDQILALNDSPKDVAGAGDSLLISSSMAIVAGANIMEGAYIGSLAAACQVSRVGNLPLEKNDLLSKIEI